MPELPEVETIKRGIEKVALRKTIQNIILRRKKLRTEIPIELKSLGEKEQIIGLKRKGKYLIIELENGYDLVIHFGMSGRLTIYEQGNNIPDVGKHDHFDIELHDNTLLRYNDARRFGMFGIYKRAEISSYKPFAQLGLEPHDKRFNLNSYKAYIFPAKKSTRGNQDIKSLLLSGKYVVGVGNIYACESLYLSKIDPRTPCKNLNDNQIKLLIKNIKKVLNQAIESGGSSLKDYRKSDGSLGYFQHNFKVYARDGLDCYQCHNIVQKITQKGRSSWFCPKCQTLKN